MKYYDFLNGGPIPDKSLWFWLTYDPVGFGLLILLIIAILFSFGLIFLAHWKERRSGK